MKRIILFAFIIALTYGSIDAQNATVATGGTATGSGGSVTYTAGQIAVQTVSDGTTTISEGVQQPFEISVVGVDEYPEIVLNAIVYPNPTHSHLKLVLQNMQPNMEIRVFDMNGKFMFAKKIQEEITEMDFSTFAAGTYFVNVFNNQQQLKSFKVVKMAQ